MKFEQIHSVQNWLQIEKILSNGLIKTKNSSYIKIIEVSPINYNLKTELEKEAILSSYKKVFQNCNFNLQVLIQSKKEDLSKHIKKIKDNSIYQEISKKYIEYIEDLSKTKKSSSKNFYIIIKENTLDENKNEKLSQEKLQEKYLKLKEAISRCGNILSEITNESKIKEIIISFLNPNN